KNGKTSVPLPKLSDVAACPFWHPVLCYVFAAAKGFKRDWAKRPDFNFGTGTIKKEAVVYN
ncbi:MAG: hypothetical protein NTX14_00730, partial [Candidatus Nealsonbacteria bacterium]|nr:hypothetical protein [Candidatus Nealsonbacteria bacterium]